MINDLFRGLEKLDLATHCTNQETTEENKDQTQQKLKRVHLEQRAYEVQRVLRLPTLKTRRVYVRYIDVSEKKVLQFDSQIRHQGFLLEPMSAFTLRTNSEEISEQVGGQGSNKEKERRTEFLSISETSSFDKESVIWLVLLEGLIGNGDFFIKTAPDDFRPGEPFRRLWNVKIYEDSAGHWHPLAYDYNLSQLALGSRQNNFDPVELKHYFTLVQPPALKKIIKEFCSYEGDLLKLVSQLPMQSEERKQFEFLVKNFISRLKNFQN